MRSIIYHIYQLLICVPVVLITLIILTWATVIGCHLGNPHFWAYYPGKLWSKIIMRVLFLPIKVEGKENIKKGESYVFVSNHQGAFDIPLIYGYLNKNFKWMMKWQLFNIPFIGATCRASHHIPVDKRSPRRVKETYDLAREVLKDGMSLVLFPEGSRSFTGHMCKFKRGGFMLADELQLPVVPLTINGSFNVKPRQMDLSWIIWHPLTLTIHKPIYPISQGSENQRYLSEQSFNAIQSSLTPEYQGIVDNPDQ